MPLPRPPREKPGSRHRYDRRKKVSRRKRERRSGKAKALIRKRRKRETSEDWDERHLDRLPRP